MGYHFGVDQALPSKWVAGCPLVGPCGVGFFGPFRPSLLRNFVGLIGPCCVVRRISLWANCAVMDLKPMPCSDDLRFVRQTRVAWFYWVHVLVNALVLLLG